MGRLTLQERDKKLMEVYDTAKAYIERYSRSPTRGELSVRCGLGSNNSVKGYLIRLAALGYIRLTPGKRRNIVLVPPEGRDAARKEWAAQEAAKEQQEPPPKRPLKCLYPAAVFIRPPQNTITRVKPGDIIRVEDKEREGNDNGWSLATKARTYRVCRVYPHHVSAVDAAGFMRSFCYGDLMVMGLEQQSPELEAKRIKTWDGRPHG